MQSIIFPQKANNTTIKTTQDSVEITTQIGLFTIQSFQSFENGKNENRYNLFLKKADEKQKSKFELISILQSIRYYVANQIINDKISKIERSITQSNDTDFFIDKSNISKPRRSFFVLSENEQFAMIGFDEEAQPSSFGGVLFFTAVDLLNKKANRLSQYRHDAENYPFEIKMSIGNTGVCFAAIKSKLTSVFMLCTSPSNHNEKNYGMFSPESRVDTRLVIKKALSSKQECLSKAALNKKICESILKPIEETK